jgi:hypothetical protein
MDRAPPVLVGRCTRLIGHVGQVVGAPGGATFCSLDGYHALKGPTSPLKGLDAFILAHILAF